MRVIAKRSTFDLQYEMKPRMLSAIDGLSSGAKDVYTFLYNKYNKNDNVGSDNIGQYVKLSRKAIGAAIGKSVKTVIGYVVELVKVGLIKDRRMGVKEINRIYFFDVDDKYKYEKKQTEDVVVKEDDKSKSLMNQVRELISPEQEITRQEIKGLLIVANNNIEVIRQALGYALVRKPDNLIRYLSDAIRDGYYKTKVTQEPSTDKPSEPQQYKKQQPAYHRVDNHNHDTVGLENLQWQLDSGQITKEEYNIRVKALW